MTGGTAAPARLADANFAVQAIFPINLQTKAVYAAVGVFRSVP
jgi:hypothetical protein